MSRMFEGGGGTGLYAGLWLSILYVYTGMYIDGMIVLRSGWTSRTGGSVTLLFGVLGSVGPVVLWVFVSSIPCVELYNESDRNV